MTIAVTGAAGSIGKKVVSQLAVDPKVGQIIAIDKASTAFASPKVQIWRADLLGADLTELLTNCDSIIHLAEDRSRRADHSTALQTLERVLEAATAVRCRHIVLLSSALVYGASEDNPIPITEAQPRHPTPGVTHATIKATLEERVEQWVEFDPLNRAAFLRPTTTLSERGVSWIAGELRSATSLRTGKIDPPVQYLHHDDLVQAICLITKQKLSGPFNVAPDRWISAAEFRDLCGQSQLGLGDTLAAAYGNVLAKIGLNSPSGLELYVAHPWVVANDRLRSFGWEPTITNEEAYVAGTPTPVWDAVSPQKRQEVALGAAGVSLLVVVVAIWRFLVRVLR